VIDFRIQAVTGHFYRGEWPYSNAFYEGEGSAFTDFSVKLPLADKPGTSKPYVPTSSVVPSNSGVPSTSESSNNQQQTPWTTNLPLIIATVCIITIPLVIMAYYYGQRKTKPVISTFNALMETSINS
jgi:hypothetical protein